MNNSAILWEKEKNYYVTNIKNCDECGDPFKEFVVVTWLDNQIKLLHLECNKKNKQFKHIKANIIASVVEERPKGAVFVGKPFDYLSNSNNFHESFFEDGVKVVDKTVHAGRESFKGSVVGILPENRIEELDSEIADIDAFLLGVKESTPFIEEKEKERIEKK